MTDIFKDKSSMLPESKRDPMLVIGPALDAPFAVEVTMTPDQARQLGMSNYPRHSWMDVHNVRRPRFGYGY